MTAPTGQKFVQSKVFLRALHEAGLLPEYPYVSRVVIDADVRDGGSIVRMYVDVCGCNPARCAPVHCPTDD